MDNKSIEMLRNGLEDSHWYSAEDAEVFEEMKRKAEAFDEIIESRQKVGNEIGLADYYETEDFGKTVIDIVDRSDSQ